LLIAALSRLSRVWSLLFLTDDDIADAR
jgi:hypothetical protein